MVLGLKGKNRRSTTVQIDYLVHIQEIKPWPPTQSLRSLRSVLIQWGNGGRSSGSTNVVVPSLGSVIGEGKIEFNESFNLPVTLLRDMSVRGGNADVFQKNCLEFNLYEPRRDKAVKGQLLGTALIDLADYGMLKETLSISAPLNCKRNFRNTDQPLLFIKIQPIEKDHNSSSLKDRFSKAVSKGKSVGDSVLELMNEEYTEEAEIASFTDDDISSHSSVAAVTPALESNGNITPELQENGSTQNTGRNDKKHPLALETRIGKLNTIPQDTYKKLERSSPYTSSVDELSSHLESPLNGQASISSHHRTDSSYYEHLNQEFQINADTSGTITTDSQLNRNEYTSHGYPSNAASPDSNHYEGKNPGTASKDDSEINDKLYKGCKEAENYHVEGISDKSYRTSVEDKHENEISDLYKQCHVTSDEQSVTEGVKDQISLSATAYNGTNIGSKGHSLKSERLNHVKSVRSPTDSTLSTGSPGSNHHAEVKGAGMVGDAQNNGGNIRVSDKKDSKVYPKEARGSVSDSKINLLESKIKMLEGELREAAAIEVALYSIVAEHGSSMSKIYAPARRLSRLYFHACKENIQARRAGAAKSAVHGLVLVAKACGNDVPRLTFWLSNSIVLRTIICQTIKKVVPSATAGPSVKRKTGKEGNDKITLSLRWKGSSPRKNENTTVEQGGFGNWDDPLVYISALEKVEAWIFSRIVESIWWLTMTPHMQHRGDAKFTKNGAGSSSWKTFGKLSSSRDHEQGKFSQDIWKNAFREAYEKLCPIRAGGHECGCLPVLSRLIMEQCVARLDVAMFNAILRESADEIPTDPLSDPISDPKVLPVPLGKSSFGAGVQLKTAIGNWSRWLTDLFGIDEDDSLQDNDDLNDGEQNAPFKSFHLLNALSELLMLPKDMLLGTSARSEVCPMFSAPVIKRILNNFAPDEFCPDPIPTAVFEALDSEEDLEDGGESVKNFPCIATPIVYMPPPASSTASIIGEVGSETKLRRSRSSVLRKAYASDDELDELNSPLSLISNDGFMSKPHSTKSNWKSKEIQNSSAVRYKLLTDVWANSE
ncbi:uncharacterized protein LOC114742065 isoform X2 [Neltuma alba]|uniref:uncharacterized protein LOC114729585 isoform X2 n=1 Tax=Neltuma alba TaxID=207710 RepID=UPI0010A4C9C1|nr:uncharacterized protein LOC114729585 isoform X2 [Prosopis alba]XP_028772454.1 uncharacterized protein LOC114729595 isoform X2 [Prosopis alba]XP_028786153.1 uncharacterized protein LOC114742065 isoform X2 [Prosopis alba]